MRPKNELKENKNFVMTIYGVKSRCILISKANICKGIILEYVESIVQ
jgi:hypothetical protein